MASPASYARRATLRDDGVRDWDMYDWHAVLNRFLVRLERREITRGIIEVPPRHGKSELCSHWFPVWYLDRRPTEHVIVTSYEATFAATWGRKCRDTVQDNPADLLRIQLDDASTAANRWDLQPYTKDGRRAGGGLVTAGIGGPITGRGANLFIIDDPVKNAEEASSALMRERNMEWWRSTARTRLQRNAEGEQSIALLIMTRWNQDDLAGQLMAESEGDGEKWEVLRFPAICEDENELLEQELGRQAGDALWPERIPVEDLHQLRITVSPFWWAAMYQQRPVPLGGGIFGLDDWGRYEAGQLPAFTRVIQAWDTAYKAGEANDRSVCATFGETDTHMYLLDVWKGRVEFLSLESVARGLAGKWGASVVAIEDAASGQSLLQVLRRSSNIPVIGVRPDGDKVQRAHSIQGYVMSGRVLIPNHAEWLVDFLDEMASFPNGVHDDQVDAFVYGVKYLTANSGVGIWL
jgi:predicted phage terminase large subunit-like protein